MKRPKITAATATKGTTDSINNVSFILSVASRATPPIIKINCLKNSAIVDVRVS